MALLDSLRCDFVAHGDDLPIRTDGTGMYHESIAANRFRMIKRTEGVSTTTFGGGYLNDGKADKKINKGNAVGCFAPCADAGSDEVGPAEFVKLGAVAALIGYIVYQQTL